MAALGSLNPTLLDLAKRTDPTGKIASIVEILNETNEILDDMVWLEGNLPTGHRTTVRTGIPAPTWRKMYGFVQPTKSTTAQVTDNTGMLEAYAEVDKALVELNGNAAAFRMSEDKAILEGMSQEMARTVFFGNEGTKPESFTGLYPRFNSLTAANGENILSAGGTVDLGSIWLVLWGSNTCHGIVPKNSQAGLRMEDKGVQTVTDATGTGAGRMEAYVTHYRWDAGLSVRDWRYVVRICNISKQNLSRVYTAGAFPTTSAHLPDLMFQAMRKVPNMSVGKAAFYMSRDMATWVARQTAAAVQGSTLTMEAAGADTRFTERFHGVPLRRCDVLSVDETLVV